jgi:hypothetical protein
MAPGYQFFAVKLKNGESLEKTCRISSVFVWANFSPDTAGHMALKPMWTAASPRGGQSESLFVCAFLVHASKNNTLSLSTLLCMARHHASEVQRLFSTQSLHDVSWGKVCILMEWRNTPGRPGWGRKNNKYYFRFPIPINLFII